MERLTRADRASAIAAAAVAHEFNTELTVILNGVAEALIELEPGHPARIALADAQRSVQRCARTCACALEFGARRGVRPSPGALEALFARDEMAVPFSLA